MWTPRWTWTEEFQLLREMSTTSAMGLAIRSVDPQRIYRLTEGTTNWTSWAPYRIAATDSNPQLANQLTSKNHKIFRVLQSMARRKLLWTINEWQKDLKCSKTTRELLSPRGASSLCVVRTTLTAITWLCRQVSMFSRSPVKHLKFRLMLRSTTQ